MFSQSYAYELKNKSVKRKTLGISLILHALLGLFLLYAPLPKNSLPQESVPERQFIKIVSPVVSKAPLKPQIETPPPAFVAPLPQKMPPTPPMPRQALPATKPILPQKPSPSVAAPTARESTPALNTQPAATVMSEVAGSIPAVQGSDAPVSGASLPSEQGAGDEGAAGAANVSVDSIRSKFISALEKNKVYPYIARKQNQTGTVSVVVILDGLGNLQNVRVVESSGFSQLDNAAIALVRKICPFSHNAEKVITMNISINYDLKG